MAFDGEIFERLKSELEAMLGNRRTGDLPDLTKKRIGNIGGTGVVMPGYYDDGGGAMTEGGFIEPYGCDGPVARNVEDDTGHSSDSGLYKTLDGLSRQQFKKRAAEEYDIPPTIIRFTQDKPASDGAFMTGYGMDARVPEPEPESSVNSHFFPRTDSYGADRLVVEDPDAVSPDRLQDYFIDSYREEIFVFPDSEYDISRPEEIIDLSSIKGLYPDRILPDLVSNINFDVPSELYPGKRRSEGANLASQLRVLGSLVEMHRVIREGAIVEAVDAFTHSIGGNIRATQFELLDEARRKRAMAGLPEETAQAIIDLAAALTAEREAKTNLDKDA